MMKKIKLTKTQTKIYVPNPEPPETYEGVRLPARRTTQELRGTHPGFGG